MGQQTSSHIRADMRQHHVGLGLVTPWIAFINRFLDPPLMFHGRPLWDTVIELKPADVLLRFSHQAAE